MDREEEGSKSSISNSPTLPEPESSEPLIPETKPVCPGPYRLLERLGSGGMGEVWEAEQVEPFSRRVAVKIVKRGLDTEVVIARFEAERQALAMMDHPCVARVFDAGSTADGRPFFVMELVRGEAITLYCDRRRLGVPERLQLFQRVCEGVQHAHRRGILHRDIKPSNILVSDGDDQALPKIIDFGLAKAMEHRLAGRTFLTEIGMLVGTPEYMSPEQAAAGGLDVDTRTDVYSLGVLLCELLAGTLPIDPKTLRGAGIAAIQQRIREIEPLRPSDGLSTLGTRSVEIARRRGTDPLKLARTLRGDLDRITLKALEKDRTRRYESPGELSADIDRYLRHQPVQARPAGFAYEAGKFFRRHRIFVSAASISFLALIVFAGAMGWQARRIALERSRAEWVSQFLISLFHASDPGQNPGQSLTARDLLDRGAEKIGRESEADPVLRARVMAMLGRTYEGLGLSSVALQWLTQAVQIQETTLGPDHRETIGSLHNLGVSHWSLGHYAEAEQLYTEALERGRRGLGEADPQTLTSMANLSTVHSTLGNYEEAERLAQQALQLRLQTRGREHPETLSSMMDLALIWDKQGRWPEAEKLLQETLEIKLAVLGPDHPETLKAEYNLALIFNHLGRFADADELYNRTFQGMSRTLGATHPFTLSAMSARAMNLANQGSYDEAETLHLQAWELQSREFGPSHPATVASLYNLGCLESLKGNREPALDWLRRAIEAGYSESEWMKRDSDLKTLHDDPEFKILVERAAGNASTPASR